MYGFRASHVKFRRPIQIILALLLVVVLLLGLPRPHLPGHYSLKQESDHDLTLLEHVVTLVVARRKADDTTWLTNQHLDWEKVYYTVDDPKAKLTVPKNKGREAMVYLT